jgi:outer membrane lipoprotein carrier protein
MSSNLLKILALSFATALAAPAGAQSSAADELARSLQKKYETVRDFSADFMHSYEGGVLRQQSIERGRVLVKKPGKMRWEYRSPEEKLFVSDGVKIYSYIPQDKQVIVSSVPPEDQAATPALFLTGKGNLVRDFVPTLVEPPPALPGTVALKLTPRKNEPEYESLVLVVDRKTLQIRSLSTSDRQGGRSTFTFSNLRENVGISDKEFTFRIPRGVDVISDTGPSR